jgi:hypothetical protein
MSDFVNYKKRSIQLGKGCKDLADALKVKQRKEETPHRGAMGNARCDHCGGPAIWGSSTFLDGVPTESFRCEQCCEDLNEFYAQPENTFPENIDSADEEVVKKLEDIERRADEFIRRKVAERKGAQ